MGERAGVRVRLGVLASHEGTTLQAVLDACAQGALAAEVAVVISNNAGAGALDRARAAGVPACHLSGQTHPDAEALDDAIRRTLTEHGVDLVLLAGYMKKVGPRTLEAFRGRVINTHPALLPKFGGRGMYGLHVHRAVLAAGEKTSGVSVHLVDADYDTGPVVAQAEVPVEPGDTVDTLAARVRARERGFLVEVLAEIAAAGLPIRVLDEAILWRRIDVAGHESCRLYGRASRRHLVGTAVFAHDGRACRLEYAVTADLAWRTVSATVSGWVGRAPVEIEISADGARGWRLNGTECPDVAGCVDIDLSFSPSTNALPIRRLDLAVGQEASVRAARLRFPGFALDPLDQRYLRTGVSAYRYALADGSFTADLAVSPAGLVTSYPGLWVAEAGG